MKRYLPHAVIFAIVALVELAGLLDRLDNYLMDWRLAARERSASGDIVVVEIDQVSLRQLNVWPWPRSYHAELIERLTDAGAAMIAIDVDFSSLSSPREDAALAEALEHAEGRVVLPVFRQLGSRDDPGSAAETGPSERFLPYVRLGSVVAAPEADGLVRRATTALPFEDRIVPSIAAMLSGRPDITRYSFHVDYSIDPDTIPRVSYVDVLRGNFAPGTFAGRRVLVGSTAVELGDQLPVPRHISLPGPLYLTLAAESMRQDRMIIGTGPLPTLAVALLLAFWLGTRYSRWSWTRGLGISLGATIATVATATLVQVMVPVSVNVAAWLLVIWLCFGHSLVAQIDRQALRIFRQRMAMLHRANMMRQVVESSFDGILTVDRTGRISVINPAATAMFGYDQGDLSDSKLWRLLRLPDEHAGISLQALLADDEPPETLLGIGVRKDGSTFDVELSIRRVLLSQTTHPLERRTTPRIYLFLTVRDVTARRMLEQARERATIEAEAASRAKSEFLAAVSHELRTPLNAIIGFSEMMQQEMLGPLGNASYRSYIDDIHRSGSHLLAIVNDILDVSRIEAGQHDLQEETIDLRDVVDTCGRLIRARPEATGLTIESDLPEGLPGLTADARAVKQILLNLLANAVKFTEAGTVCVSAGVDADGAITVAVSDTGIGIPADELKNVLRPFYQVDSSLSRHFEGTGLGLSLVASLMQLHGGSVAIDSTVGQGTTVACRFPPPRTVAPHSVADVA